MTTDDDVAILKTIWSRGSNGQWGIAGLKSMDLKPQPGFGASYFRYRDEISLMTSSPRGMNVHEILSSFGTTDFLLKQSILPVIAWVKGKSPIRCIGTAFVVSCTGHIVTAAHVLLDPYDSGYGKTKIVDGALIYPADLAMGVLIPVSAASGQVGFRFFPIRNCWYWGQWEESPLLHEKAKFRYATDIAICKIDPMPNAAHQPLNMSLRGFSNKEAAYVLGYAEMPDIEFEMRDGQMFLPQFPQELYVSVGEVIESFPENHVRKDIPAPGPCFDIRAKMPGRMSGGPIFGGDGAVVRGVVSRSFSGEEHGYGAMLGPVMRLPLDDGQTFQNLMKSGAEGIPIVQGAVA